MEWAQSDHKIYEAIVKVWSGQEEFVPYAWLVCEVCTELGIAVPVDLAVPDTMPGLRLTLDLVALAVDVFAETGPDRESTWQALYDGKMSHYAWRRRVCSGSGNRADYSFPDWRRKVTRNGIVGYVREEDLTQEDRVGFTGMSFSMEISGKPWM